MKVKTVVADVFLSLCYAALSCCGLLITGRYHLLVLIVPAVVAINVMAGVGGYADVPTLRLKFCRHGTSCLIIFFVTLIVGFVYLACLGFAYLPNDHWPFTVSAIVFTVCEFIMFSNGIISVYCTSVQLGIRIRVLGLLFGLIPPVNLIMLWIIIKKCAEEVRFETEKSLVDLARADEQVCRTKYPILLVHGFFFRDYKHFNYWGRIPYELSLNGAIVYYGDHQSAGSVKDSAKELTEKIEKIVSDTGCEKMNVIAHSKGGLDCRCAIKNGAGKYVASLTTVSTPHRGCIFADYLLTKISPKIQSRIARTYNCAAHKLGDPSPDFMAAVHDLTAEKCAVFDKEFTVPEGIFCQSVGSEMRHAGYGRFPLNLFYHLVKNFSGANDGLVSYDSFRFGEKYTYLVPRYSRGISHGDMIDLNRENIKGFDVREFYVGLVKDLKERGL